VKRELLKDAYQILAGIPPRRFIRGLDFVAEHRNENDWSSILKPCGALACGIGWLALYPGKPFERIGIDASFDLTLDDKGPISYTEAAGNFFDIPERVANDLFGPRDHHWDLPAYDREPGVKRLSDKRLLLYRIRRVLGQSPKDALYGARRDG